MPAPDFLTLLGPTVCALAAVCVWWRRRRPEHFSVPADDDIRPANSPYAYASLAMFAAAWFTLGSLVRAFPSQ